MSELLQGKRDCPTFATQREEDEYWERYHAQVEARSLAAFDNETVTRGTAARLIAQIGARRLTKEAEAPVEMDPNDARQARELAAQREVDYKDFVRKLVHEPLERELSAAG